jgi:hypothetical protein
VLGLQGGEYTPSQLSKALDSAYWVDNALIDDGTYFAVETSAQAIVGWGGWSDRKTLVRARRGIATIILNARLP